jgi:hypothetical protein
MKPEIKVEIEKGRSEFASLVAANPNYFGNLTKSAYEAAESMKGNTKYEELTGVAYSPERKQLEAPVAVKLPYGYSGGLCQQGSREYVRFYVDSGSGWTDVGVVSFSVHDIPASDDCADKPIHPLMYTARLDYSPRRRSCKNPQVPRVRAILSWTKEPPENDPGHTPVWGNVTECHIQIAPWALMIEYFQPAIKKFDLDPQLLVDLEDLLVQTPVIPLPPPTPPLSFAEVASDPVIRKNVEPERFAFTQLQHLIAKPLPEPAFVALKDEWKKFDLDLSKVIVALDKTKGNVSYEELEELGIDNNTDQLAATFRIKKQYGYSGGLCSNGSNEYVSFWVDWDDSCNWSYLDTVKVKAHDLTDIPDSGICYAAVLPVDLSKIQKPCNSAVIGRVRAVLSWNSPPSTTDPDKVPYWGNRIDAHVQVRPGDESTGLEPKMVLVGGVSVNDINNVSGMTGPGTLFADNGLGVDAYNRPCPFGQRVVVRGVQHPGHRYKVEVQRDGESAWTKVTRKFWVTPISGSGSWHHADSDGYFPFLSHAQNFSGILAWWDTTGNDRWTIRLSIEGVFGWITQKVQLDNTSPGASVQITSGLGNCGQFTPGELITGKFVARDLHFNRYSLTVKGHPTAGIPSPSSGTIQTSSSGDSWQLDTTGMHECGYIIEVHAVDRTIRNSIASHWRRNASVGFCIIEP